MSKIEVLYDILFDENEKKSYKSLNFLFKNINNQIQDVSSVFIIIPERNYKEQNDNNGEVIIFISQTNVSNKLSH